MARDEIKEDVSKEAKWERFVVFLLSKEQMRCWDERWDEPDSVCASTWAPSATWVPIPLAVFRGWTVERKK